MIRPLILPWASPGAFGMERTSTGLFDAGWVPGGFGRDVRCVEFSSQPLGDGRHFFVGRAVPGLRTVHKIKMLPIGWRSASGCIGGPSLATTQAALAGQLQAQNPSKPAKPARRIDLFLLLGITVALAATIAGIRATGVSIGYFLQPTGAVIVLGGTLGVILITTPRRSLFHSFHRVRELINAQEVDRFEGVGSRHGALPPATKSRGIDLCSPRLRRAYS